MHEEDIHFENNDFYLQLLIVRFSVRIIRTGGHSRSVSLDRLFARRKWYGRDCSFNAVG